MAPHQQALLRDTLADSNAGRIHFGEVVQRMIAAGVESYAVDYRSHRATYAMANDDTLTVEMEATPQAIGRSFDAAGIRQAIRGVQQGAVMYPEFKQLTMAAGCVGYTAWIAGRQVTYYGRKGETHVEPIPIPA